MRMVSLRDLGICLPYLLVQNVPTEPFDMTFEINDVSINYSIFESGIHNSYHLAIRVFHDIKYMVIETYIGKQLLMITDI